MRCGYAYLKLDFLYNKSLREPLLCYVKLPELSYNDILLTYLIFWSVGNIRLCRKLNIVEIGAIRQRNEGSVY